MRTTNDNTKERRVPIDYVGACARSGNPKKDDFASIASLECVSCDNAIIGTVYVDVSLILCQTLKILKAKY